MLLNRQTILAVYSACFILLVSVILTSGSKDLNQVFLNPLDESYSILGKHSVFKDYLGSKKVYTFLPYWNLDNRDINLNYVSDLSYFGLNINEKGRVIKTDGGYKKWREDAGLTKALKEIKKSGGSPSVTLICQDDETINAVLSCEECWKDLAEDVKNELVWSGINDINVDFEYSGYTTPDMAAKYSKMVGYINNYLDKITGGTFVVVSAYADSVERSEKKEVRVSNPHELAGAADAIFIMAYDFHRPTSSNAGPVSPLDGSYATSRLNLKKTVDSYLKIVPANKLILGLPFYGYDWIVEDETPMSRRIEGNDSIGFSEVRTYSEITDLMISKRIQPTLHDESKSFYFNYIDSETGSKRQVWFDNADSLKSKIALATKNGLLGVGVWALGYEGGYADLWKVFKSLP